MSNTPENDLTIALLYEQVFDALYLEELEEGHASLSDEVMVHLRDEVRSIVLPGIESQEWVRASFPENADGVRHILELEIAQCLPGMLGRSQDVFLKENRPDEGFSGQNFICITDDFSV